MLLKKHGNSIILNKVLCLKIAFFQAKEHRYFFCPKLSVFVFQDFIMNVHSDWAIVLKYDNIKNFT